MIQHTFCILPGIGEHLEKKLWRSGILTWGDFLAADSISFMSADKKEWYNQLLSEALQNLESFNVSYFAQNLRHSEHWRLYPALRNSAVALDIETDGGTSRNGGRVTIAGLYDGFDYTALVQGKNLSREKLAAELSRYRYIITFFGAVFDLPYLRDVYGLSIDLPHFDLCFGGRRAGLRGGLKKIEKTLGMQREESVAGFDGFDAMRLWHEAQRGNDHALELLITYNRYDTVNLFALADVIYQKLRARTGIESFFL
jgi:uncharacterized protein YprB with RNaseH-like and TPR domain